MVVSDAVACGIDNRIDWAVRTHPLVWFTKEIPQEQERHTPRCASQCATVCSRWEVTVRSRLTSIEWGGQTDDVGVFRVKRTYYVESSCCGRRLTKVQSSGTSITSEFDIGVRGNLFLSTLTGDKRNIRVGVKDTPSHIHR